MAGIVRKRARRRNRELGAIPAIQSRHFRRSIRQMDPLVLANLNSGRDHDFPGMMIGIGKITGITGIIGTSCRFQKRRAF
jgi:hypothetical protein